MEDGTREVPVGIMIPLVQSVGVIRGTRQKRTIESVLVGLLIWPSLVCAQSLPSIKATVGRPVIQELMGGCSLTCSFPWNAASASSARKLSALNDSDAETAWTDAHVGDKLIFKFPADLPRELNGTPFYGVDFANGRLRPDAGFADFGRMKRIRLWHNEKALFEVRLADTPRWQQVEFDDIYLNVGDTLTLEILETFPGKVHSTASITEIVLQGAH